MTLSIGPTQLAIANKPAKAVLPPPRFSASKDQVSFSGEPFKLDALKKFSHLWRELRKKVLKLLQWACGKLGLTKQRNQLHLKRFPNHQAILEHAQKNATFSTPAGGMQLLDAAYEPEAKRNDHPKGLFFIDGVPIDQPTADGDLLRGMHIWLNSKEFNNLPNTPITVDTNKLYNMVLTRKDISDSTWLLTEQLTPEQAKPLLDQELAVLDTRKALKFPYTYTRRDYLDTLFDKVGQKPELMSVNPKWFVNLAYDDNNKNEYKQELAGNGKDSSSNIIQAVRNERADKEYLTSLGYIPVDPGFHVFKKIPRTKQLIDKLVQEGKIPAQREDRKIDISA